VYLSSSDTDRFSITDIILTGEDFL